MEGDIGEGDNDESRPEETGGTPIDKIDWAPVLPSLQRFYGHVAPDWWNISVRRLQIYMDQMPILEAQENLRWAKVISVGNGLYKKPTIRRIIREWRQEAGQTAEKPRKPSKGEFMGLMGMLGVSVQEVPLPEQ